MNETTQPAVAGPVERMVERLREYATAWRALGCGCGDCSTCAARDLKPEEADEAADELDRLRAEVAAWRGRFKQYEYRPQDDCIALRA